ncbi:hypothetical protein H5P28_11925 [Ruficoccus amylovorans]|uniref:Uncharacterized protein n=1 Tax=Ruficoccus amylovorans TaxID=1804625 RepID=A0A842HEF5_9BACT|nr:hypothetical protein [Ruficoccus amylovorans]MBC2594965.1 hypothetical protein [Ruficoccus amylovorans]
MKTALTLLLALSALLPALSAQSLIVDDPFDSKGGWTNLSRDPQGWWPGEKGSAGLTPKAGSSFFSLSYNNEWQRLVKRFDAASFTADGRKQFGGGNNFAILPGTYELTVYVGLGDGDYSFSGAENYNVLLTAGGDEWKSGVAATSSVKKPAPRSGAWVEWTFTFVIDKNTRTKNGDVVIGQPLGAHIALRGKWSKNGNENGYIAADGFKLKYTPPSGSSKL